MPPARAALPALTDTDVTELRAHLDRGATPRVRLHAGGTGTVVSVGDPDTDGPEYIKVKVTLNGTRDSLPFAPEDLASTSRSPKAAEAKGSRRPRCPRLLPRRPLPAGRAVLDQGQAPAAADPAATYRTERRDHPAHRGARSGSSTPPGDGTTITEGAAVSAEVVQAVADHLHDAELSGAVADVATVRRSEAAIRVERLRAELTAAQALLTSYTPGSSTR